MTYNWNTMVEITVPTGTNGWLYSGEVIINGVKVRFPVGVPTSVPEPAAVLLKKMIELEQEEDANTAKPQNHYVGDVTIPAGKTLTLEKGAMFVDKRAPSEVVILPETVLTGEGGQYRLPTAPENSPVGGGMYKIIWGGVEYTSPAVDFKMQGGAMGNVYLLGNTDIMGYTEVIGSNPAPDAPYVLMIIPDGATEDGVTAYGMMMSIGITPEPPVLSIVQTEGASADSGSGGGILTVNCSISTQFVDSTTVFSNADKTWAEVKAAHESGKIVRFVAKDNATPASDYIGNVQGVFRMAGVEVMSIMFPKSLLYGSETLCSASANDDGTLKIAPSTGD